MSTRLTVGKSAVYIAADSEHPMEIHNAAGAAIFHKNAADVDTGDTELAVGSTLEITEGTYFISAASAEINVREVDSKTIDADLTVGDKLTVGGELEANGDLNHDGAKAGFFGTAPAARPKKKAPAEISAKELAEGLETLGLLEH